MSASSDHQSSGEEESRSTALTNSPVAHIPYHPFSRQLSWTSGQLNRPSGSNSQRSSPGVNDLASIRSSWGSFGMDPPSFATPDAYHPPLPSFSSPPAPDLSPPLASNFRQRSAPDQSSLFGARSEDTRGWGSEALITSNPAQEGHDRNTRLPEIPATNTRYNTRGPRPPYNRDEFDGPAQLLPLPLPQQEQSRAQALLELPCHLSAQEQAEVSRRANDILSQCAFHFIAKYQFPIPIERERRTVRQASDRDWNEWAHLLKRLATKRRIPARVLYEGQIRQLVVTLENARAEPSTSRQGRDDRYLLQHVSSALQVARILQDSVAMEQLNQLYVQTEDLILERRSMLSSNQGGMAIGRLPRLAPGPIGRAFGSGSGGGGVGGL